MVNWLMVAFTGIIAVATLWYVVVTTRLWKQTKRSADATKFNAEALINSERAWVQVEVGKIPEFTPDPTKVEILWIWPAVRNWGRTPARIVKDSVRLHQVASADGLPEVPEYQNERVMDFILPPNAPHPILQVGLSATDFIKIKGGQSFLYLYGFVDYLDIGNARRQTRFCFYYHVPHGFNAFPEGFYPAARVPSVYTECT
jgi:hypothetical protein